MNTFDQIANRIIKEQEQIIGPLSWEEAGHVKGLHADQKTGDVSIVESANRQMVIDRLVEEYEVLFGRAAREVCRAAVLNLIADLPVSEIPSSLK